MLLKKKNAIVYGAGGAVGSAVALAFAQEGAQVFLAGRTAATLEPVADKIRSSGGRAHLATVDVLDEDAVEAHAAAVVSAGGSVDVSFNAISLPQRGIQGVPLAGLSAEAFELPVATYSKANFLTARAAARRMTDQGSGVIMMITASPSRTATPLMGGMAPAWAAIEALSRGLAAELGPSGVRVVCLNAAGMPDTPQITEVYQLHAEAHGISRSAFEAAVTGQTLRQRLPRVAEIANVAAFAASYRASAMTGAIANLTGGLVVD
ncbi:SDR family NAD(P)-dependent oxidoreductase [Streptacidiphilus fuscans]|uniref:SDR family oxidoreductase n=1 Tax=Streptacidiphilus fuscans TaxID=2789292 RepID=A0A931B6R2_9ACTN|nr:SDR family oxidoreductase [Streptacidiphilus fuscans]MBF9071454.1 SDR family oxidoreductase [Streptacidiphilus fuscans]